MRRLIQIFVMAVVLLSIAPTNGQETSATISNFHAFFAPFFNSEWSYHAHMTNSDGSTLFEGEDLRKYALGIKDRFVIESAYSVDDDGNRTHVGMTLIGVNVDTGRLNISAFWPWQSTALGNMEAEIFNDISGKSRLRGTDRPAGQQYPIVEVECVFRNADEFHCVTQTTTEDGVTFKSNDALYTRR